MDTAHQIREAVARVTALRSDASARPELAAAVSAIKRLQARRFAGTYYDLLESGMYAAAAPYADLDEIRLLGLVERTLRAVSRASSSRNTTSASSSGWRYMALSSAFTLTSLSLPAGTGLTPPPPPFFSSLTSWS